MNPLLMLLLIVLALILATNRRQVGNAKTLGEMWEPARANGWGRGTACAIAGLVVFALLFLGGITLPVITVATKVLQGAAFVASVVREHLTDLLNPPIPIARVEAA